MANVQFSDVITYLFDALPEIRQYYEIRSTVLHAHENPHVIYGSILVEYIEIQVNELGGSNHATAEQLLKKAFHLIEELSASSDFDTRCLIETGVLESLLGEKGGLERFAPHFEPETKKLARVLAQHWRLNVELLS